MSGTITYNFVPNQTVWAIVPANASPAYYPGYPPYYPYPPGYPIVPTPGYPPPPIIVPPTTGNTIIVREGVVKQMYTTAIEKTSNAKAQMDVQILGGVVMNAYLGYGGSGYYPDVKTAQLTINVSVGNVTGVTIVDGGGGYANGTGFTLFVTASAGGGDGLAQISYDVVNGIVVNASILATGSGYTNGSNQALTEFPATTPLSLTLTTTGGGASIPAVLHYYVVDGVITNVTVFTAGSGYAEDGPYVFVSDVPDANELEYTVIYRVLFSPNSATLSIQAPTGPDGVEISTPSEVDIFATVNEAIAEYQVRLS